jgi:DNA polymerase-3 subunit delta
LPVVKHTELKKYLQQTDRQQLAPVYLICGEAYLCKSAFDTLLSALLPKSQRSLNYESFDGVDDVIGDVLASVNTYSLLPGTKVVALRDARLFYTRQDDQRILKKVRAAYNEGHLRKAAKLFTGLLGLLHLSFDDVAPAARTQALKLDGQQAGEDDWLDPVIAFCGDNNLSIPTGQDGPSLMQAALEKGFPDQHHLVLTTDVFDRRRSLYKSIQEKGVVIDCSVPKGSRQADKSVQETILNNTMQTILKQHAKRIEREAYQLLHDMTGFDLATFTDNLQKLINYVGTRKEITVPDVEALVRRTKTDPIYAFTNALADRSTINALFFLDSLLTDNMHPLQILAAMTNQIRKLLIAKDFEQSANGREWHAGISFGQFQQHIVPAVQAHDRLIKTHLAAWEPDLANSDGAGNGTVKKKKQRLKKKSNTGDDLLLAKNPKNAYPIYQTLLKAANFSLGELLKAFEHLSQTDLTLKTTVQNPKTVLEEMVLAICGPVSR